MQDHEAEAPQPVVSVLIVSRDCLVPLRRCLEALRNSPDRASIEVLVVDNGSRDGCAAIDSDFPDVTVLRLPHHFGLTKARNIGIRTAKAEFLLLLSPDIEVLPNAPTQLAARLAEAPAALGVCPLLVDPQDRPVSRAFRLPDQDTLRGAWKDPASLPDVPLDIAAGPVPIELHDGKAILIRRQTIQGINYLDQRYGEQWIDAELAFQIRRAGRQILLIPDVRARLAGGLPEPSSTAQRAAYAADAAQGASRYLAKRFGWFASFAFLLRLILGTLGRLFIFREFGYHSGLLTRLVSGSKIDGTDPRF